MASEYMLVNIAWNHSNWSRFEPNPRIGFGYVKRRNMAAFTPHEALNFDFSKEGVDTSSRIYGYFQTRYLPKNFYDGGLIFFWSRSTDDGKGYFVGVYGNAGVLSQLKKWHYPGFENDEFLSNIYGDKKLSCLFPCPVEDSTYKKTERD